MTSSFGYLRFSSPKDLLTHSHQATFRREVRSERREERQEARQLRPTRAIYSSYYYYYYPSAMFSFIADKLNVKNLGEMLAPTLTPEQEFHAAIEAGMQDKVLRFLDEMQLDPNTPTATGNLPVHTASYHGRINIIELLFARNVDVNVVGPRDNTPLHFAASQGHEDAVRFLVNSGANPALRNRNGKTPYDVAKGDRIRQYLLPLQFRHEDPQQAASFLPPGITPSVDPLAPKPEIAPPPLSGDYSMLGQQQQQAQVPHNPLYAAATHSAIPRGGQSRITRGDYRPIQADGFGSSVGNEALTAKFGNTREIKVTAPPPSLGAAAMGGAPTLPPPTDGSNPYSAQPRAGAPSPPPQASGYAGYAPPASGGAPNNFGRGPPQFKIFNPKLAAQNNSNAAAPVPPGSFGSGAPNVNAAGAPRGPYMQSVPLDSANDLHGEEVNLSANASVLQ